MSSIVSNVLRLSCGLLINKLPESTVDELKHGDEKEQKFRELILEELDSMLSKLELKQVKGKDPDQKQVKKELFASILPFKEGLVSLYQVLDKTRCPTEEGEDGTAKGHEQRLVLELDIAEDQSFYNAKANFKKAREDATRALGNDDLSLSERLLATKIQVAARILESMANQTDAADAVGACKVYLQDLHSLPSVCEAFDIHFNGGIKSWFRKKQRVEIITCVALINRVVYKYADSYAGENVRPTEWPTVDTGSDVEFGRVRSRSIHPVTSFRVRKLIKEMKVPLDITIDPRCFGHEGGDEEVLLGPTDVAVNSHGQVLVADGAANNIKVYSTWGKYDSTITPTIEGNESSFIPRSLATDREDNVYVLSQGSLNSTSLKKLFVLNKQGNVKHKFALKEESNYLSLTVDDNSQLFLLAKRDEKYQVEVYKTDGEYLRSFHKGLQVPRQIVAAHGEILVTDSNGPDGKGFVKVFDSNGRLARQFKVMNSYANASGIAFNPFSNIIALVTRDRESLEGQVEVHDLSGKLLFLVPLAFPSHLGKQTDCQFYGAAATSEGRVAVVNTISTHSSKDNGHDITQDTEGEASDWDNLSNPEQLNTSNDVSPDQITAEGTSPEQNPTDDVNQNQNAADDVTPDKNAADDVITDKNTVIDVSPDQKPVDDVSPDQNTADDVKTDQNAVDDAIPDKNNTSDVNPDQNNADDVNTDQNNADDVSPDQNNADNVSPDQNNADVLSQDQNNADEVSTNQINADVSPDQNNADDVSPDHNDADDVSPGQNETDHSDPEQNTVDDDNANENIANDVIPDQNATDGDIADQETVADSDVSEGKNTVDSVAPGQDKVDENYTSERPSDTDTSQHDADEQPNAEQDTACETAEPDTTKQNGLAHVQNSHESTTAGQVTADTSDHSTAIHMILII